MTSCCRKLKSIRDQKTLDVKINTKVFCKKCNNDLSSFIKRVPILKSPFNVNINIICNKCGSKNSFILRG